MTVYCNKTLSLRQNINMIQLELYCNLQLQSLNKKTEAYRVMSYRPQKLHLQILTYKLVYFLHEIKLVKCLIF